MSVGLSVSESGWVLGVLGKVPTSCISAQIQVLAPLLIPVFCPWTFEEAASPWGTASHKRTQIEFLVPSFSLAQPPLLQGLGSEPADESSLSPSLREWWFREEMGGPVLPMVRSTWDTSGGQSFSLSGQTDCGKLAMTPFCFSFPLLSSVVLLRVLMFTSSQVCILEEDGNIAFSYHLAMCSILPSNSFKILAIVFTCLYLNFDFFDDWLFTLLFVEFMRFQLSSAHFLYARYVFFNNF